MPFSLSCRWLLCAALLGIAAGSIRAQSPASAALALVGARVYPDPLAVPVDDAVIVVTGDRIAAVGRRETMTVPPGAKVVDCSGLVITAAFYNAHVHFTDMSRWGNAAARPASMLSSHLADMLTKYGYTTVVDTASDLPNTMALRKRIASGEVSGPRILTAGSALYPPDGVPYYVRDVLTADVVAALPQPAAPDAARGIVRRQFGAGADLVKLFTGSWVSRGKVLPMPVAVATAAVDEAHGQARLVYAHPSNLAGLEVALDAGVDVLAHAIEDTRGMTERHYQRLKKQNVAMIPTLTLFSGRWSWDIADEVRTYSRLGGSIMFGTDVGYLPDFDHASEYELLASAGLGWREILAALTTTPASRLGHADSRGKVAPGYGADLVVLGTDPVLRARAFADVRLTIREGVIIYDARSR